MCNLLITPFVMDDTVYRVFAYSTVNAMAVDSPTVISHPYST